MQKVSTLLTVTGAQKLKEKLQELKRRHSHVIRDLNDKDSAASIMSIKHLEKEFLAFDIQLIENVLSGATIVKTPRHPTIIDHGTTVRYRQMKKVAEITLVNTVEADASMGLISIDSPLGQAMIGHKKNDTILVATPKGINSLTILKLN